MRENGCSRRIALDAGRRPLRDTRAGDTDEGQDQFSIEAISRLLSASHRLLQSP
jgi:hypothetical protein